MFFFVVFFVVLICYLCFFLCCPIVLIWGTDCGRSDHNLWSRKPQLGDYFLTDLAPTQRAGRARACVSTLVRQVLWWQQPGCVRAQLGQLPEKPWLSHWAVCQQLAASPGLSHFSNHL